MSMHRPSRQPRRRAPAVWKLQDAKACFSQVVRDAQQHGPQHITVHGKEAAVVLSAAEYARLAPSSKQPSLHELLSKSPLKDLEFEHRSFRLPVREVEL